LSQTVQARSVERLHSVAAGSAAAVVAAPETSIRSTIGAISEATKPRITRLVTITSGVGFVLAAIGRPWAAGELMVVATGCLVGTALSAGGANTLNQWAERDRDALMPRTARRPIPDGRLSPGVACAAGVGLAIGGLAVLWLLCGIPAMVVSAVTILSYLLLYTPLKPVTPLATLVGAVPGALPPVIGWAAGSADPTFAALASPLAWSLFAIMFVWQIPHFLAIGWMYKADYAAGGYKILPVVDATGRRTARSILLWSIALVGITMAPAMLMNPAPASIYAMVAGAMGIGFLLLTVRLVRTRERTDARRAFVASVIHLPLLLVALVTFTVISSIF
jgi:heme o synthase